MDIPLKKITADMVAVIARGNAPIYTHKGRYRDFSVTLPDLFRLYLYLCLLCIFVYLAHSHSQDHRLTRATWLIGTIGIWRYGWWMTNLIRALYFAKVKFPAMRSAADTAWQQGWRPNHMHFLMTTFHEKSDTTRLCLQSIVNELRHVGVAGTLWVGTGAIEDEQEINRWCARYAHDVPLEVVLVRQNQPGKRVALGVAFRALSRRGTPHPDDLIAVMDGDSVFIDGCLKKCLSIFGAFPTLSALTTDQSAVCYGPQWTQKWLTMRFAQRRLMMQSHAVSNRVLTLTGRMSIMRARDVLDEEFIRTVEADFINHWFWGSFRFLSGDDKSTWYCLLKRKAQMTYVPDAMICTIEYIEGSAIKRAKDNQLRWSGNMLRNGMRAIALGPRVVPPFIWWCLIDQRLAIWSTLWGFFTSVFFTLFVNPYFIFTYIAWSMGTRFMISLGLFAHADRIRMSFPLVLYCNQMAAAFIKMYIVFRLPMQNWANRLDQANGLKNTKIKHSMLSVAYINLFYLAILAIGICLLSNILVLPNVRHIF